MTIGLNVSENKTISSQSTESEVNLLPSRRILMIARQRSTSLEGPERTLPWIAGPLRKSETAEDSISNAEDCVGHCVLIHKLFKVKWVWLSTCKMCRVCVCENVRMEKMENGVHLYCAYRHYLVPTCWWDEVLQIKVGETGKRVILHHGFHKLSAM